MHRVSISIVPLAISALPTSSDLTPQQQRALTGGAVGAAGGAVIGALAGAPITGALIGGARGAAVGALINRDAFA